MKLQKHSWIELLINTVRYIKEIIKNESEIDLLGPSPIYYQKLFCGGGDVSNNRRCSGQWTWTQIQFCTIEPRKKKLTIFSTPKITFVAAKRRDNE